MPNRPAKSLEIRVGEKWRENVVNNQEFLHKELRRLLEISNQNLKVIGRLVIIVEHLRTKAGVTDEELKTVFEKAEAEREARAKAALDAERAILAKGHNPDAGTGQPNAEPKTDSPNLTLM